MTYLSEHKGKGTQSIQRIESLTEYNSQKWSTTEGITKRRIECIGRRIHDKEIWRYGFGGTSCKKKREGIPKKKDGETTYGLDQWDVLEKRRNLSRTEGLPDGLTRGKAQRGGMREPVRRRSKACYGSDHKILTK